MTCSPLSRTTQNQAHTLVILYGPTGVGKTAVAIHLAKYLHCSIISADSRQLYQGMNIGTAAPTPEEQKQVPHHFVNILAPDEYYNASRYETEVCSKLEELFHSSKVQLLTGGSMLYIDAITHGIDLMPDVDTEIRETLKQRLQQEGIESLRFQLKTLDPHYYHSADVKNPKRVVHALEICLTTGKPYSSFRREAPKERPFKMIKIGLQRERQELYERINQRVIQMIEKGLVEEVKSFLPQRHCNALNTVGYKETFAYLDGEYSLERAVELIQRNSRHYAKKQITWYKNSPDIKWFHPDHLDDMVKHLQASL